MRTYTFHAQVLLDVFRKGSKPFSSPLFFHSFDYSQSTTSPDIDFVIERAIHSFYKDHDPCDWFVRVSDLQVKRI